MAGDIGTSAGGIHPGKPIIWPTGKSSSSSQQISQPQTTQTIGNVKTSAPANTAPAASAQAGAAQESSPASPKTTAAKPAATARPLNVADLKAHLQKVQVPDTAFNVKLASLMLKDGLELSRANFVKLLSMLEGTDKSLNLQEAAIMLVMKGIDSPKALQILGQFFSENPQMAQQLVALQEGIANLANALNASQGLLDSNLVAQLGALLSQLDEALQNIGKNTQFTGNNSLNSATLLNDIRGLKALLQGIAEKAQMNDSAESQVMQSNLMSTIGKLNSVMDNMTAQALLSQKGREEVNYQYSQVPNAMTNPPSNFEIVIKRDGRGPNSNIDCENTNIIMSMQTMNLGKMVCSIIVKGKKVYVIFVFNEKDCGEEARKLISNEFANLQKKLAEKDFIVSGYQVKVDPGMCSVRPYLIPMLPNLEEQLKKIDLEA